MPCCSTLHIASRKSDTTRMRLSRANLAGRTSAFVGVQQGLIGLRRQLVVDAEVAEVEERVAHAGVLPVDDPQPRPVVNEVRVQQVVVAGERVDRAREQRPLDAAAGIAGTLVGSGIGTPRSAASAR